MSAPKNSFLRWLRATDDCPETFNQLRLSPSSPFAAKYAAAVTTASVQNEVNFVVVLVTAHA